MSASCCCSCWSKSSIVALLVILLAVASPAATPSSGTVSQSSPTTPWTGPFLTPTASSTCNGPNDPSCDNFKLTIVPPDSTFGTYQVLIQTVSALSGDWDMQVYDPNGRVVGSSGNGSGTPNNPEIESVTLTNPPAGTYTVAMAPFSPMVGTDGTSYHGSATLQHATAAGTSGNGTEPLSYAIYPAPPPLGQHAGEPSCGVDWNTKKVFFEASGTATLPITTDLQTLRVTFNDCTSPATASWENVTFATESLQSLDAILFTDRFTNRTFVSQLTGQDSISAFSDDDGTTWTPSQGGGIPSGVDHETVGGGPYHAPLTGGTPAYHDAVYYCSQDLVTAFCARSDDGGLTYGAGIPTWTTETCGGIHGHVKVSPADGTVYVPNKSCGGKQGVAVSIDNGITWNVNLVPGTTNGDWDPSVGIATDGTVYFGDNDGSGHPLISISHDRGTTWTTPTDVGAFVPPQQSGDTAGIKSVAFPEVVAGDPTRAAFVFLGSTFGPGGGGDDPNWGGVWHLYSSHTYDGGTTWTTLDVAGNDPVQRHATICSGGINCANGTRNLLDFNDATIDQDGRVVIAYADGCVGQCASGGPNSFSAVGTLARQTNGRRMFAVDDVLGVPAAPLVSAQFDCSNSSLVHVSWSIPDDHGSPITGYNIYRSTNGGPFVLIQSVGASVNEYDDAGATGTSVKYEVKAVNAVGEGSACSGVSPAPCPPPPPVENACIVPGVTVLTDAVGDATDKQPGHDIVKLSIAEPSSLGPGKLMFILKMVSLQNVPPNTTWPVLFHAPAGDFWVRMSNVITPTNTTGAIKFAYGSGTTYTALSGTTDNPGTPADAASGFNADGTISIVISRSAIGNPAPGAQLTQFLVRISVEAGAGSLTPDNMPDSLARSGTYAIKGSENCAASCGVPTANPDSATTTENQPVEINVVGNDKDGGSPPLTVTHVTKPANGTATNNSNGTVTYNPNSGFTGTDSFQYTIQNGCGATATATVTVTVSAPPPPQCFEDDDPHFAYDNGWHTVQDSNASAGHYHLKDGKSDQQGMSFTFELQSGQGTLQYFYAMSSKGGSANVYIDGVFFGSVSYQGGTGSMHSPTFGVSSSYTVLNQGTHTFELRDINGAAYVDKICLTNSTASGPDATSAPGTTSVSVSPLAVGQQLIQTVTVPTNALGFSALAEGDSSTPYTLVIVDPMGNVLGTANSANGIAEVQGSVSKSGLYVIKLINNGTGSLNVWLASTPFVQQ